MDTLLSKSMSITQGETPLFFGNVRANFPIESGLGEYGQHGHNGSGAFTIKLRNGVSLNTVLTKLWLDFCFFIIKTAYPENMGNWVDGSNPKEYSLPNGLVVHEAIGDAWLAYELPVAE